MRDVLVLGYHAVSPTWPAAMAVTPQRLDAQLSALRGRRPATFTAAVAGSDAVAITFDDGLRSVLEHAAPLLDRHGLGGTVFVATGYVGRPAVDWPVVDQWLGGEHEAELAPMGWDELRELAERGWEIGSHTRTHPHLPALGDEELATELRGSRAELEDRLGVRCTSLAYPYGDADRR